MSSDPAHTITVVCKHKSMRCALSLLFEIEGYKVLTYRSAASFLDSLPERAPTCVVIEVPCPGLEGHTMIDQLLSLSLRSALVALTVNPELATRLRTHSQGQFEVVLVASDALVLIAAVRRALSRGEPPALLFD